MNSYKTPLPITGIVTVVPSGLPAFTSTINIYNEILVPYNTETTIISYTVPTSHTVYITGFNGSGDTVGEFYVKIAGTTVSYSRSSASNPSCSEDYFEAPITAAPGQTITISTITYENASTHTMRATLKAGFI